MSSILMKIVTSLILMLASTQHGAKSLKKHYFIPKPQIPPECLDKEYCEYVPNYPTKYAASLIAKFQERSAKDLHYRKLMTVEESEVQLTLCYYEKKIVTPQAAKDLHGEWHFILNQKTYPMQQFMAITCKQQHTSNNTAKECYNFMSIKGATAECQQKNTTIELVTFNRYGKTRTRNFDVPCCCSCEVVPDFVRLYTKYT